MGCFEASIILYICDGAVFKEMIKNDGLDLELEDFENNAGFCLDDPVFRLVNKKDSLAWLIWVDSGNTREDINKMIIHESVHAVSNIISHFKFHEEDDELRAYLTQYVVSSLMI